MPNIKFTKAKVITTEYIAQDIIKKYSNPTNIADLNTEPIRKVTRAITITIKR